MYATSWHASGVGDAKIYGSGDYAMRLWLDPDKIAALGMTAGDVVEAVREQNVGLGRSTRCAAQPLGKRLPPVHQCAGRLVTEEEFGDVIVKTGSQGQVTRLRDVARVEMDASSYSLMSLLNNKPAVAISVLEAPGANAIEISDQVRAKMDELAKRFPEGVEWSVEYDSTVFVRQSIKAVVNTLLEAIGLVVLVVILFLQTWRASIIPLLAVPVSVVGTFAVLLMLGFSINTLTLLDSCLPSGSWWTTRSWWWKTSSATSPKGWRRWLRPIRPCAKSVAPSSPSRWCCARYSCLWHSCPA